MCKWFKSNIDTIIFGCVAVLIFIWVWIGWSNPPSKQAYNPYDVPKCEAESCEGLAPPPNVNPKTGQTKKTTNKEIEEWRANRSDLAAQWETADATRVAFRSAVLGIWLLFWTIWATRKTTSFAEQTLNSTKETSYKELRAYLGIVLTAVPIKQGDETLAIRVTIKNFGQTPAYNIGFAHSINFVALEWGGLTPTPTTAILNPTETFSPRFKSKKTDISKINGDDTVYFHLTVNFVDMNSENRWVKVLFSKSGKEWPAEGHVTEGAETMYLVKMETGDLHPDDSHNA